MKLRLIREKSKNGATLGSLYVDDEWLCWTLEDEIRQKKAATIKSWKVPGETAIPDGVYKVTLRTSPRFAMVTPYLNNVPGFDLILIHPGNKSKDTEGCILVGMDREDAFVGRSRVAYQRLMERIHAIPVTEPITITVENPAGWYESA